MIRKKLKIVNKLGLCARASALLSTTASKFACDIKLVKGDIEVNPKSMMAIMVLAAGCGSSLELIADGKEEAEAVKAITELVAHGFDEY